MALPNPDSYNDWREFARALLGVLPVEEPEVGVDVPPGYSAVWRSETTGDLFSGNAFASVPQPDVLFQIDTLNIADAAVGESQIQDLSIGTAKIKNAAIVTALIGDLQVVTAKIGDLQVNNAKLADLSVSRAKIQLLAVSTAQIDDLSVTNAKMGLLAVGTANIQDLSVTTAKINALAVTNAQIANLAVGTANVQDLSVTTAKIALLAVGAAQIGLLQVGTGQIADLGVTTAKIADLNVTTGKIANLAVDSAKIALLAVDTGNIKDLAVDTLKIAGQAVTRRAYVEAFPSMTWDDDGVYAHFPVETYNTLSYSLVLPYAGTVIFQVGGIIKYGRTDLGSLTIVIPDPGSVWTCTLKIAGVAVQTMSTYLFAPTFSFQKAVALGAGTHSVTVEWTRLSNLVQLTQQTMVVDAAMR